MPKGYWLVQTDITDPERHAEYVRNNRPVFARYGARIVVRWGQHQVVEGVARSRQVVFEFPDYASAVACYHDPEYDAAHKLRVGAADGDVVIVEGYDGPQPDESVDGSAPPSPQVSQAIGRQQSPPEGHLRRGPAGSLSTKGAVMPTNPPLMKVLLTVRTRAVADGVIAALRDLEVQFLAASTVEEADVVLRQGGLDHVILGGGLDLESRLLIVRHVFEASNSTTVHMNSPTGPETYLPFVRSVVHGLLTG